MYSYELIKSKLSELNPRISFHKNGDFGDINRIEIERNNLGVTLDFWSRGWLSIHVIDYLEDREVVNRLLEPKEEHQKKEQIENVFRLLKLAL